MKRDIGPTITSRIGARESIFPKVKFASWDLAKVRATNGGGRGANVRYIEPIAPSSIHVLTADECKQELGHLRDTFRTKASDAQQHKNQLVFLRPPGQSCPPSANYSLEDRSPKTVNTGPFALDPGARDNLTLLAFEDWLLDSLRYIEGIDAGNDAQALLQQMALTVEMENAFEKIEMWRMEEWDIQRQRAQAIVTRADENNGYIFSVNTGVLPFLLIEIT